MSSARPLLMLGHFGDLRQRGFAQASDRAEHAQQVRLASLAHAGAFIQDAFFHTPAQQELMIAIGPAMRFIADALQ